MHTVSHTHAKSPHHLIGNFFPSDTLGDTGASARKLCVDVILVLVASCVAGIARRTHAERGQN
jgi:hypothetical protein